MEDKKRMWAWVGAVVVVLALILVFSGKFGPLSQTPAPSGPGPVYAPQGQLVAGFPTSLILDQGVLISNSYSIKYIGGANQYTAQWTSTTTLSKLFSAYQNYFSVNGWKVSNVMAYPKAKGLHAENATSAVGVSIIDSGKNRAVTVTYVAK
jgi:hypothetical protein